MFKHLPLPCAIVDIETTGGNVTRDRIIEIAIVEVTAEGVSRWSTLINPRTNVPASIQRLTGITPAMLEDAPYFEQVAKDIVLRLQDKVFVAHNVRFDYGFIRNEFARLAYRFKSKLLCTVKLSRSLYAQHSGHSLEKIIARHGIRVSQRHRALDDAVATYEFMQIAEREKTAAELNDAIAAQQRNTAMPTGVDASLIDELPNGPGIYYFWGEQRELLYIGKSVDIRKRVLSHFTADHKSAKEMTICQQTRSITYEQTAGELSALILESKKVKALQPLYNRKLRRVSQFYTIELVEQDQLLSPRIIPINQFLPAQQKVYGLFPAAAKAKHTLQQLCEQHNLCYQVCGIEAGSNRACTSYQLKKCQGFCVGKEKALQHNVKLLHALAQQALKTWPYTGAVALIEKNTGNGMEQHLLIKNWCILGIAESSADYNDILEHNVAPQIDKDIYRYLVKAIYRPSPQIQLVPVDNKRLTFSV
uniref:exonuclease domain-containing protein n=1 Tax=Cellvibrio fontiphilus TaxID=1815559 RepID=UPI002B4C1CDE|nr:exonuclease domain-containing protein [Cellvibrio fontiphilus]